jgi:hypothetical protein
MRSWIVREKGEVREATDHGKYIVQIQTVGPFPPHTILAVTEAPTREEWDEYFEKWFSKMCYNYGVRSHFKEGWMSSYDLLFGPEVKEDDVTDEIGREWG